jgi:hypothetical protein
VASADTSGGPTSTNVVAISDLADATSSLSTVDNSVYRYMLRLYYDGATSSDLSVYGVKVEYGWPVYVPAVMK